MILGVDHIAVSGTDLAGDGAVLESIGLTRRFAEPGLDNARGKAPLLWRYDPLHDIAVYDPAGGVALEITVHDKVRPRGAHAGYVPVMTLPSTAAVSAGAAPAGLDPALGGIVSAAFGRAVKPGRIDGLDAPVWRVTAGDSAHVFGAAHAVADVERSSAFFTTAFRARIETKGVDGRPWHFLRFASPVPRWTMGLLLIEDTAAEPMHLDDAGWPCLAMLSSKLETDAEASAAAGGAFSFVHRLTVNGRELSFGVARGPCGELVELLHIQRN